MHNLGVGTVKLIIDQVEGLYNFLPDFNFESEKIYNYRFVVDKFTRERLNDFSVTDFTISGLVNIAEDRESIIIYAKINEGLLQNLTLRRGVYQSLYISDFFRS